MPPPSPQEPRRSIVLPIIGGVILLAIVAYIFMLPGHDAEVEPDGISSEAIRTGAAPRIPVSPEYMLDAIGKKGDFQALISYTDNGFEPALSLLPPQATVRFVNNASSELWIAGEDGAVVARLAPREFWQHTFTKTGTEAFSNDLRPAHTATIEIQE